MSKLIKRNYAKYSIVCLDINVVTTETIERSYTSWSLGGCNSSLDYTKSSKYVERCCLLPGWHTLSCHNVNPEGWPAMRIEILGHPYCDDFFEKTARRRIIVDGNKF